VKIEGESLSKPTINPAMTLNTGLLDFMNIGEKITFDILTLVANSLSSLRQGVSTPMKTEINPACTK